MTELTDYVVALVKRVETKLVIFDLVDPSFSDRGISAERRELEGMMFELGNWYTRPDDKDIYFKDIKNNLLRRVNSYLKIISDEEKIREENININRDERYKYLIYSAAALGGMILSYGVPTLFQILSVPFAYFVGNAIYSHKKMNDWKKSNPNINIKEVKKKVAKLKPELEQMTQEEFSAIMEAEEMKGLIDRFERRRLGYDEENLIKTS